MKSPTSLHALTLAASLGASFLLPGTAWAASIGKTEPVGFGSTVVSSFCEISTGAGSLGVSKNRNLITSDSTVSGSFTGARTPGTISVTSNLGIDGELVVDAATLSGGPTTASLSQIKLVGGKSGAWSDADSTKLNADGSLATTNINVQFEPTGGKFANGTYTAAATVTCTDNGTK